MKFLKRMCVYILFMLYFGFDLYFLEIKVFVFVKGVEFEDVRQPQDSVPNGAWLRMKRTSQPPWFPQRSRGV